MKQYIEKSALVAEIERRIKGLKECHADTVAVMLEKFQA
jgi:hypothetical protein